MLELIIVIGLMAVLATLIFSVAESTRASLEQAACVANLKGLHGGMAGYLADHNAVWPQPGIDMPPAAEARFWIDQLEKYGISEATWFCKTATRYEAEGRVDIDAELHYLPTLFDDFAHTPFRWARMPWFAEVGDFHGNGNLMIFADGSVRPFEEVGAWHSQ